MAVAITHPRAGANLNGLGTRMLIASGRADSSTTGVLGQCALASDPTKTTDGTLIVFRRMRRTSTSLPYYRWMIHFALPQNDLYELTVCSLDKTGKPSNPQKVKFHIVATHSSFAISSPNSGDDLSACKDDFVPYGSLNPGNDLQTATMTSAGGKTIALLSSTSDCSELLCWSADFDTLVPDGTLYTLTVTDTASQIDKRDQLIVS